MTIERSGNDQAASADFELRQGEIRRFALPAGEATLIIQGENLVARLYHPLITVELRLPIAGGENPSAPADAVSTPRGSERLGPERAPRVTYTGRVGRDPVTRTTPKGRTLAKIPLAIHQGERTEWRSVLFFDKMAQKAVETLTKGQLVTIAGYEHSRDVQRKSGEVRQVTEIYGVAIRHPETKERMSSS